MRGGAVGGLGLAGAVLIGCGEDDDDGGGGGSATTTPPAGGTTAPDATGTPDSSAGRGGILRAGMSSDLTALEPHVGITAHRQSIDQVWDYLVRYNTDLQPEGLMAESWEVNDDYTEIVLHIRPNQKWHLPTGGTTGDGIVTAEDIVLNINRAADPNTSLGQMAPLAREYEEVEAPDENTVILRSSIPRLGVFDFLVQFRIGEPTDIENPETAYGSGPYFLGEWRPGDQFDLQRFPEYWNPDIPRNDGMIWSVSVENQTLVAQFDSNALDIIPRPSILDFVRWRDGGTGKTYIDPQSGSYYVVGYNTSWAPFDDVRVRQALTYTIDKKYFTDTILKGTVGEPYSLPWLPASPAYEADKVDYYMLDKEKAAQLLDAAGVGAFSPEVWMTTEQAEMREMSEAWQQDVADLGKDIELIVNPVETALFVETINARPPAHPGIWFANSGRAELLPFSHFKSANVLWDWQKDENTGYGKNNTGYYSDRYNQLLTDLEKTGDPEAAKAIYSQINDVILEDNFISFLAPRPSRTVTQNHVMGEPRFMPGLGAENYLEVWMEA